MIWLSPKYPEFRFLRAFPWFFFIGPIHPAPVGWSSDKSHWIGKRVLATNWMHPILAALHSVHVHLPSVTQSTGLLKHMANAHTKQTNARTCCMCSLLHHSHFYWVANATQPSATKRLLLFYSLFVFRARQIQTESQHLVVCACVVISHQQVDTSDTHYCSSGRVTGTVFPCVMMRFWMIWMSKFITQSQFAGAILKPKWLEELPNRVFFFFVISPLR